MKDHPLFGLPRLAGRLYLATEAGDLLRGEKHMELPSSGKTTVFSGRVRLQHIHIFSDQGSKKMQRAMGNYLTFSY